MDYSFLKKICQLIRYDIITATSTAGSGHPTSSLSAVELMTTLFFSGFFHCDLKHPDFFSNDRVIFSKGHASPLLYSLYHAAGAITYDELMKLRTFDSPLEGHPTPRFPFVEVATGSLGQGLSIGLGMTLGIQLRIKNLKLKIERMPRVYVLLGDSEMAEGEVWEALQLAAYYKLDNLIGILDINRLGQRGETMLGWDIEQYQKRIASFGWKTVVIDDGHDLQKVHAAFEHIGNGPTMIIAKTIKGKGVSFLENKDGWHGKAVPKDMLETALKEIGEVDLNTRGKIKSPEVQMSNLKSPAFTKPARPAGGVSAGKQNPNYKLGDLVATREAYGDALVALGKTNDDVLVLDGEVSNSTYSERFKKVFPERFFEMFIAEQNMVSAALGLSKIGYQVYASSFAAFLTRALDQLRMAQYSNPNIKLSGSHAGVSIGSDGPSQMALEDLSMARSLLESTVLYPSDAVSGLKLTEQMLDHKGISYIRTTREKTPVIYSNEEKFEIGGSKIHGSGTGTKALIISAGITVHEALQAQKQLAEEGIETIVLDCYSIKPIDKTSINRLAGEIKNIIVVEDHYPYGGLGEAVTSALGAEALRQCKNFVHLAVHKIPRSGTPEELLRYEEIDAEAIKKAVSSLLLFQSKYKTK